MTDRAWIGPYKLSTLLLLLGFSIAYADERVSLHDYRFLAPDFNDRIGSRGEVTFDLAGFNRRWTLNLDDNRTLVSSLNAKERRAVRGDDNRFLSGSVVGIANSWVRLSRVDGRWSGGFFDGEELYLIDRPLGLRILSGHQPEPEQMLLYRFSDLDPGPLFLHRPLEVSGQQQRSADFMEFISHLRELTVLQGGAPLLMPITVVTDTQFNSAFGFNTAAVVASRTNFIDGLYSGQLGTGITLFHHEPLSGNGPLTATSASELLTQFRLFMSSGAGSNIPFQGLGHLFTGRSRDGGIAGIAYLGVLCSGGFGYGVDWNLSNETTNSLVYAHEVGHNFNAPHDGENACSEETFRGIMNPSINGSQQFSDCSLGRMSAAVAIAGCLIENPDSQVLFINGFED